MNYVDGEIPDQAFLDAVAAGHVARFGHLEHLRLAYALLRRDGAPALAGNCREAITRLAARAGDTNKYHETRTIAWTRVIVAAAGELPDRSFAQLLLDHPQLARTDLLDQHYSAGELNSDRARRSWIEPDRRPLPGGRTSPG